MNVWCSVKDALPLGATKEEQGRPCLPPPLALGEGVPPLPGAPRGALAGTRGGGRRGRGEWGEGPPSSSSTSCSSDPRPRTTPAAASSPIRFPVRTARRSSHLLNAERRGQPRWAWTRASADGCNAALSCGGCTGSARGVLGAR